MPTTVPALLVVNDERDAFGVAGLKQRCAMAFGSGRELQDKT